MSSIASFNVVNCISSSLVATSLPMYIYLLLLVDNNHLSLMPMFFTTGGVLNTLDNSENEVSKQDQV